MAHALAIWHLFGALAQARYFAMQGL
jgi:hypothetical protein